jgi:cytochrome c oxidase cbb3-type subunit III
MRDVARGVLFVSFVLVGAGVVAAGQSSAAPRRGGNPEAAKIANPVQATPDSVAAGRRVYIRLCANCHGPSGKGDGNGAAGGAAPADLTDATWDYGASDGEIFSVIRDGTSADMGSYAERLSQQDIWNVVNYVRSLSGK